MRILKTFLAAAAVTAVASIAAAVQAENAWAETQTFKFDIEFSREHECTREPVVGDTRVHMVVTTTDNPDGSMHVRVHQQQHGQSLFGAISGDEYVFNEGQDSISDFDIVGGETGQIVIRTEFIHRGEDQAFLEVPGLDDLHQRTVVRVAPFLPPMIEEQRTHCR